MSAYSSFNDFLVRHPAASVLSLVVLGVATTFSIQTSSNVEVFRVDEATGITDITTLSAATLTVAGLSITGGANAAGQGITVAGGVVSLTAAHSGTTITATTSLISSGTLSVEGTVAINGVQYSWPSSDGSATGKVLKTDSAGNLSWSDDNTGGGGTVQANRGIPENGMIGSGTLAGRWLLNEWFGVRDAVHSADQLTDNNTVTALQGIQEVCAQEDFAADFETGDTTYLSIADNARLSVTGDLTIMAWVKLESSPATDVFYFIVSKTDNTTSNNSYDFAYRDISNTEQLWFQYSDNGTEGANLFSAFAAVTLTPGVWNHVAVTVDVSTQTVIFYVDDTSFADANSDSDTPSSIFDSSSALNIGRLATGASYFDGLMQDVRIVGEVLSSEQIINTIDLYTTDC